MRGVAGAKGFIDERRERRFRELLRQIGLEDLQLLRCLLQDILAAGLLGRIQGFPALLGLLADHLDDVAILEPI